ncbi:hypothetical protein M2401_001092 [Pseudomonas sp. JUb42]|uniref:AlbA family DNA-binding domain-containing protein n=1 Tax=Pseudomonas sp. JUb42 TaxID=2940611 RepID=UPI00216A9D99|nr:ATP-binding protein [Pseudomonas sp. JUb42]MCS3467371.1 hypothetical protein [Pseudomonas sp. JUb42]
MNDDQLIDMLLYKGEGAALDYKVQQYPHDGATPEEKGELLKDILAFSNAWREETAYILIGVNDNQELVGLDNDLDDARLQQFINGKTNAPVHFSYRSLFYKGVKLGIYTILKQERPIFAKQQYGKVIPDVVYVRRGSATAIAKPDEIAKMGEARIAESQVYAPDLKLEIISLDNTPIQKITFSYKNYELEDFKNWPDYSAPRQRTDAYLNFIPRMNRDNEDYFREIGLYHQQQNGLLPIRLLLTNIGTNFADDVRIYLSAPRLENLGLITENEILAAPIQSLSLYHNIQIPEYYNSSRRAVSIALEADAIVAVFNIGKIQTGETISTEKILLERPPQGLTSLGVKILSDQLRKPMQLEIPVEIQEEKISLGFNDVLDLEN